MEAKHSLSPVYVRCEGGRLAQFRRSADSAYWEELWHQISDDELKHGLRATRRLGAHRYFFRGWLPRDGVILEAGCGFGLWVQRLRQNGWNCMGLDYATASLSRSKAISPHLPLVGGDVFRLPIPNDSLAGYVSFGVAEHFWGGPESLLRECFRVLRKGGVALISVPYDSPLRRRLPSISEAQARSQGLAFFQYYFTPGDFRSELAHAGLAPTKAFHGYSVIGGLVGPLAFLKRPLSRLGPLSLGLNFIPLLPRLAAHMMFTAAIKP